MSEHFTMYITITDVVGEKRIKPIQGKEVAIVSMLSDNVWYLISEPVKVLLITNEERQLQKGTFMGRELSLSIGGKLITTPLVVKCNIAKTDELVGITEQFLAWMNSTTLTKWKTEDSEMSYLGIMWLVMKNLHALNQPYPSIRDFTSLATA